MDCQGEKLLTDEQAAQYHELLESGTSGTTEAWKHLELSGQLIAYKDEKIAKLKARIEELENILPTAPHDQQWRDYCAKLEARVKALEETERLCRAALRDQDDEVVRLAKAFGIPTDEYKRHHVIQLVFDKMQSDKARVKELEEALIDIKNWGVSLDPRTEERIRRILRT